MNSSRDLAPPAYRVVNEAGKSSIVLVCEHASRYIPEHYVGLGLSSADLERHIAWDIGAESVAVELSRVLDAQLILANYSRLIIDLNRPLDSATSIPEVSETTRIPGNSGISLLERRHRASEYFTPFHQRLTQLLDAREAEKRQSVIVGVHSFTPSFKGVSRPWHAGVLFRRSQTFGSWLAARLGGSAANIAENEPYRIEDDGDYTVPVHGEARGLDAVLVEIRQDLIATEAGAKAWATRLADALQEWR